MEVVTQALEAAGCPLRGSSARCPAHDDHNPSLSVTEAEDGKVLLLCRTGCSTESVLSALKLSMSDLFPSSNGQHGTPQAKVVARYPYTDENDLLLYTVERYEPGFDGAAKSFVQRPASGKKGKGSMEGVRLVLYRLPRIRQAVANGTPIYVVEGEKDVEALERAGCVATCNPMGAGKWKRVVDAEWALNGAKQIIIVADKDEAGLRHAREVAASLQGATESLVVVEAELGKDAADHLGAGLAVDAFFVVAGNGDNYQPYAPTLEDWLAEAPEIERGDESIDLDELLATDEPDYVWQVPKLLERGDRLVVTGQEGHGKSTLLRQMGTQIASGIHPFEEIDFDPISVLIVDTENSRRQVRRKVRQLRDAAGERYPTGRLRFEFRPDGLDLTKQVDFDWLEERITTNKAEILVIGPLYKMATGDPKDEQTARAVALALDHLRALYGISVIMEAHTPYADGPRSKRPERPYGASLWSRWPEFGIFLAETGELRHWRGQRDERCWPSKLERGGTWPWEVAEEGQATEWDGPRHCMEAVLEILKGNPGVPHTTNHLLGILKAMGSGQGFRKPTITEAGERLAMEGQIRVMNGPNRSRLYVYEARLEGSDDPKS